MKFKDMIEGKERYVISGTSTSPTYAKKDGLLFVTNYEEFSSHRMAEVSELEFELIVKYVDFQTALAHMLDGGGAKLDGADYRFGNSGALECNDIWASGLTVDMVTSKQWILL